MNLDQLVALVTVMLALSVASERLVTVLKTAIPALAEEMRTPTLGEDRVADRPRRLLVMAIAFLASYVTSGLVAANFSPVGLMSFGPAEKAVKIPVVLVALLATGGSAFWTSILGYARSAKDVETQNSQIRLDQLRQQSMKGVTPTPSGLRTSAVRDDDTRVKAALNRLRTSPDPAL